MDFNRKGNRSFFGNKFLFQAGAVFFLLAVACLVFVNLKMYWKKRELISQINSYKEQIEDIKRSSKGLENAIANADNVDYLEKIAYEQLGEQKPGEKAVTFVVPDEKPKEPLTPPNFWASWLTGVWNWIKNKF